MKVNIEVNHATLPGHDFAHEIAAAFANADLRIDRRQRRRRPSRLGPRPVPGVGRADDARDARDPAGGGFTTGGLNFDSKLRRQSIDRNDLFHAHIGGMDTMAHALVVAADILASGDARRRAATAVRRLVGRARPLDPDGKPRSQPPRPRARHRRPDVAAPAATRRCSKTSSPATSTAPAEPETPGVRHQSFQVAGTNPGVPSPRRRIAAERRIGGAVHSALVERWSGHLAWLVSPNRYRQVALSWPTRSSTHSDRQRHERSVRPCLELGRRSASR